MKTESYKLGQFIGGIDQVSPETELSDENVRECINADITRSGLIRRRTGYTKLKALIASHSLYADGNITLLVSGGHLQRLLEDNDTLVQLEPIKGKVSYASMSDMIYWTDGVVLGRVNKLGESIDAWVPNPSGLPTLSVSSGNFQPGHYQVAITNVDATGMESGADQAATVELTAVGGIHLTDIPQSADAAYVRVYITTPNGIELQRHVDINMGTTEFYVSTPYFGKALETQFAEPMIAGDLLCSHYGRLYVATGNTLVYSEALRPGLTRLMDNYLPPFPSDIKVVLSHTTGLYVVADKTYFLPGGDPEKMTIQTVYSHSGVFGTGQLVTASMFDIEQEGAVPYWFSDTGPVLGLSGGNVVPLTEKSLAPSTYASGATLFRAEDGIRSMVTSLQSPGDVSKLGATDSVSFEVRRNGITVPA